MSRPDFGAKRRIMRILGFFVLFSALSLNSAHSGNWVSVGDPGPPIEPAEYDYAYNCEVEVSDQKLFEDEQGAYLKVAQAHVQFKKGSTRVFGRELKWKLVHYYFDAEATVTEDPQPYALDNYRVELQVDARSSNAGAQRSGDSVYLVAEIAQPVGDSTLVRYRKTASDVFGSNVIFSEVSSDVSEGGENKSMEMQVFCNKVPGSFSWHAIPRKGAWHLC